MVVTALCNFQISGIARCQQNASAFHFRFINLSEIFINRTWYLHDGTDGIHNVGIAAGTQNRINFRQFLGNFLRITLYQTTGDNQSLQGTGLLELCGFQNGIDGFLFC